MACLVLCDPWGSRIPVSSYVGHFSQSGVVQRLLIGSCTVALAMLASSTIFACVSCPNIGPRCQTCADETGAGH